MYDFKHGGRKKSMLVADVHLMDIPVESVYSGVVSLHGIWLLVFIAELNKIETWATDIGNKYLEAKAINLFYIIEGTEFGDREDHIIVVTKELYGIQYSGLRLHEMFSGCLRDMLFFMCKLGPDIWIRQNVDIYGYISVYVDYLSIAAMDTKNLINTLENKYKFKLKGIGPI